MPKLPFIVEPRVKPALETIGSDESGKIQVKRLGYLTTSEKTFIQAQTQSEESTRKLISLTRSIGKELKIDMQKAYERVSNALQNNPKDKIDETIQKKHGEELDEIVNEMAAASTRKTLISVLALLVYRVDPEFTAEQLLELHPDIIDGLSLLFEDEEARSTERLTQLLDKEETGTVDQLDDLEKK